MVYSFMVSSMANKNTYDEHSIKILEGLEAVRKRPGMYIGSTDKKGLHHLIWELVDNGIDEIINGYGNYIKIILHQDGSVTVADNGRGVPIGKHESGKSTPEVIYTILHAGGKFEEAGYKVSGGLHGVGASVVNALSTSMEVTIYREGKISQIKFHDGGKVLSPLKTIGESKKTGTIVRFMPDKEIFKNCNFSFTTICERMQESAFLLPIVTIEIIDEEDNLSAKYHYENGIVSFVEYINENKNVLHKPIHFNSTKNKIDVEIALQYTDSYNEQILSFVNNVKTGDGGTHEVGFKTGITKAFNDYAKAIENLEAVVLSGKYALADCTVGDLHQAPQNCGTEAMLFVNVLNDPAASNGGFYFGAIGGNIREGAFDGVNAGTWMSGTCPLMYIGFGYIAPTADLYQAFVRNGEETAGTRRPSSVKTTEEMEAICGDFSMGKTWPYDNYWNWKYHLDKVSYVPDSFAGFYMNTSIMRYAEVLLLLAEAKIQQNGPGAGDEYINMIRTRSELPTGSGFTLEDLKLEKRCELALEGVRYFDLLRWDDAKIVCAEQGKTYPLISRYADVNNGEVTVTYEPNSGIYGWTEKHRTLPIPQTELDVNPNMEQTDAWK